MDLRCFVPLMRLLSGVGVVFGVLGFVVWGVGCLGVFGVWGLHVLVGLGFAWVFVSGVAVQVLIYLGLFVCLACLVVR